MWCNGDFLWIFFSMSGFSVPVSDAVHTSANALKWFQSTVGSNAPRNAQISQWSQQSKKGCIHLLLGLVPFSQDFGVFMCIIVGTTWTRKTSCFCILSLRLFKQYINSFFPVFDKDDYTICDFGKISCHQPNGYFYQPCFSVIRGQIGSSSTNNFLRIPSSFSDLRAFTWNLICFSNSNSIWMHGKT